MPKVIYRGNPGYTFQPVDGPSFTPAPGEVIDLPRDIVDGVGDDFESAGRSTPTGEFNPATAKKAELVAQAQTLGIDTEGATAPELRAAIEAHQEVAAPADDDTDTAEEAD